MEIESIRHKALRRFVESGVPRGLDAQVADRLRKMIAYLDALSSVDELSVPPNWDAHQLKGGRAGTWSLTVTRNWRLTFRIDPDAGKIFDMDLEDYH
ncbi:type II toxin-antitoxin system RelE/ParE family toxin [Pedomonas sp. V897]|uniref:type II toxin-antitoxin system RelE/ParE family toxin n=1 Tax=Pedomonas sp. V897 TaxID=3446482 RepID=UPI003EE23407